MNFCLNFTIYHLFKFPLRVTSLNFMLFGVKKGKSSFWLQFVCAIYKAKENAKDERDIRTGERWLKFTLFKTCF